MKRLGAIVMFLLVASFIAPAQEKITLRVTSWAGIEEAKMDEQIIAEFMRLNPNVEVIYEPVPEGYYQKILTDIAAGTPPDVMLLDAELVPTYAVEEAVLLNLAPYAARMKDVWPGANLEDYFDVVLEINRVGEAIYAFPKDFTPIVVFYNKRIFDKFGVSYPPAEWTWDEFMDTVKALTKDIDGDGETDVWGFAYVNWIGYNKPWIWAGGGSLLDPTRTMAQGYLNSSATVRAVQFLVDLVKQGYSPDPETLVALGGSMGVIYIGRAAMTTIGHWVLPYVKAEIEKGADIEIGITRIPRAPDAENATVIYESGWAVPKMVKHKKLAVQLAAWLSSPYAQRVRCKPEGLAISANKDIAREFAEASEIERIFLDIVVKDARPTLGSETKFYRPLIEETMNEAIEKVLIAGWTVKQALDWAAERIDEEIEKRL